MKHLTWNYNGHNDLDLDFTYDDIQRDWNATILGVMNEAFGDTEGYNIFCSQSILDIFREIIGYDEKTKTIFDRKLIVLLFDTPKIYITKSEVYDFSMIEYDNHASVTVKNYMK